MRVLHLFSNHKVTGPAELALDTCRAVERHASTEPAPESLFLPGRHPRDPFWLAELAARRGTRVVEVPGLRLSKHFNPLRVWLDGRRLASFLESADVDVLHCHLPNDHMIASVARDRLCGSRRFPIVRTIYDGEPVKDGWRSRRVLGTYSDHIVCFSRQVQRQLLEGPRGIAASRVACLEAPIDTARFDPARRDTLPDGRKALGIRAGAFTAGIVARMQTHRRFEVLLEAVHMARRSVPDLRFVIVGRGTHQVEVARDPVERMGLGDTVCFAGYVEGDDYVGTLMAMDIKLFLVPGSDGTCRAVREALAAGVPVVAARRGMLPEIVEDGVTGRVVDDSAAGLAAVMVELARDRQALEGMARRARQRAVERFSYERYSRLLLDIYARTLEGRD